MGFFFGGGGIFLLETKWLKIRAVELETDLILRTFWVTSLQCSSHNQHRLDGS